MYLLTGNMYALAMSGANRKVFLMISHIYLLGFLGVNIIRTWLSESDTFNISFVTVRMLKVYFQ